MNPSKQQVDSISHILNGYDTLVLLPTGFGKSWIYMLLPDVIFELQSMNYDLPTNPLVYVITPLNAIIENQIIEAKRLNIPVNKLEKFVESLHNDVLEGGLVYGNPEGWCGKNQDILLNKKIYHNCVAIVVDEVHKVSW